MRDKYEMQLRKLHAEMIEMGTMIEQAIETAIKALVAQDTELAKKAIEADDAIDHQERFLRRTEILMPKKERLRICASSCSLPSSRLPGI